MHEATFTELRNNAKQYFDIVEAGGAVRVLRNGKPIADIVPIAQKVPSWKKRRVVPLLIDGVSLSEMVMRERRERGL